MGLPGPSEEEETLVAVPSAAADDSLSSPSLTSRTTLDTNRTAAHATATVASPMAALREQEVARVRTFALFEGLLVCFGYALLLLADTDPVAEVVFLATLTLALATCVYARWLTRTAADFDDRHMAIIAQLQACVAGGAAYYFGVFSPISGLVTIVIYLYSQGAPFGFAVATWANIAIHTAVLGALSIAGVIDERGLIRAEYLDAPEQVLILVCIELVYLIAIGLGQSSQRKTLSVVADLESAVREVAKREALLDEARQELMRPAGIGEPGRFTEQVLGGYRLGVILGRGAMGEIYEAHHVQSGEQAAVKLLHRNMLGDAHHVARFVREARIAAALRAPNVVQILEVGDIEAPLPFIAMEKLVGRDLSEMLRDKRRLSRRTVVKLVEDVGAGLDAARARGIVHRDIKPKNVFAVERDGQVRLWKILDFGVSKAAGLTGTLTAGRLVGTPAYMAPEQASREDVDHRADVYSLAVIAYRCLTGRPAFSGRELARVLDSVGRRLPPRPSSVAGVPPAVDAVLRIAMAKAPDDRFQTAAEFVEAFRRAVGGKVSDEHAARAMRLNRELPWGGVRG